MEINGLLDRKKGDYHPRIIFLFSFVFFFLTPNSRKNTILPLSGRANAFDYVTSKSLSNQNQSGER